MIIPPQKENMLSKDCCTLSPDRQKFQKTQNITVGGSVGACRSQMINVVSSQIHNSAGTMDFRTPPVVVVSATRHNYSEYMSQLADSTHQFHVLCSKGIMIGKLRWKLLMVVPTWDNTEPNSLLPS